MANNLLLQQLQTLQELAYSWDESSDIDLKELNHICDLAKKFEIPDHLFPEFVTYSNEYLTDPKGCAREDGPFFDDDNVLLGIREKFLVFFTGLANPIKEKYNIQIFIVIDASYDNSTHVAIIADNLNREILLGPTLLLHHICEACNFWFESEDLLTELQQLYNQIEDNLLGAIKTKWDSNIMTSSWEDNLLFKIKEEGIKG